MPWWCWLLGGVGVFVVAFVGLFTWACFMVDAELERQTRDDYL